MQKIKKFYKSTNMKVYRKLTGKFWVFLCAIFLCVIVVVVVTACEEDDCKVCTNSVTNDSFTACGDELEEARKLPNVVCK